MPFLSIVELHQLRFRLGAQGVTSSSRARVATSLCEDIRQRMRLWKIASCIHKQDTIPFHFYRELIEMQWDGHPHLLLAASDKPVHSRPLTKGRIPILSAVVRRKAWDLLVHLLRIDRAQEIAKALLTFPTGVVRGFIRSAVNQNPIHPNHDATLVYSIITALQRERPLILNDIMEIDELCAILVWSRPISAQTTDPSRSSSHPVSLVIEALASVAQSPPTFFRSSCINGLYWDPKRRVPSEYEYYALHCSSPHGQLSSWDLPPFADCLVNTITVNGGKHGQLRDVVSFITSSLRSYQAESCAVQLVGHVMIRRGEAPRIHALLPFIYFSIHLAYRSETAATQFIEEGILQMLGRLWLLDFPDAYGLGLGTQARRVVQVDMRVGCILFLGALARHHPSAHELADYLLGLSMTTSLEDKVLPTMGVISHSAGNTGFYAGIIALAASSSPDASDPIPPLTLFLMENCIVNCIPMATADHVFGNPWLALMTLLS